MPQDMAALREAEELEAAKALVAADYIALRPLRERSLSTSGEAAQNGRSPLGAGKPQRPGPNWAELDPSEPALLGQSALAGWELSALTLQGLRDAFPKLQLVLRGTDDEGDPVSVSCAAFVRYMLDQDDAELADEEPLAVFDADVLYDCEALSALYQIPDVERLDFRVGLLERLPQVLQPPLRWLILGPTRSGTSLHQDPPGTCAWNVVTHGRKRWVLLSPDVPEELALRRDDPSWTVADWFEREWPGLCGDATAAGYAALDFEQAEGELVYVPPGWWHAVINLEGSVAITHNCVQVKPLQEVVNSVADGNVGNVIDVFKLCRNRGRLLDPIEDDGAVSRWLTTLHAEGVLPGWKTKALDRAGMHSYEQLPEARRHDRRGGNGEQELVMGKTGEVGIEGQKSLVGA
mmetsp:Transcript_62467/g.163975  ORF Transcript_62467/g.163975 Transcript_62467/m.163975 type:complete len:406 (-) Transcript_62467:31-1248(-)